MGEDKGIFCSGFLNKEVNVKKKLNAKLLQEVFVLFRNYLIITSFLAGSLLYLKSSVGSETAIFSYFIGGIAAFSCIVLYALNIVLSWQKLAETKLSKFAVVGIQIIYGWVIMEILPSLLTLQLPPE